MDGRQKGTETFIVNNVIGALNLRFWVSAVSACTCQHFVAHYQLFRRLPGVRFFGLASLCTCFRAGPLVASLVVCDIIEATCKVKLFICYQSQ